MSKQFDVRRLAVSTAVAAALSLGLAIGLLRHAESTPATGPTADTLEEAFSAFWGAALGLLVGSAFAAIWVRRGSRLLSGFLAGVAAYALAVAPVFVLTGADDVERIDSIITAAFLVVPFAVFVALGAAVGALIASFFRRRGRPGVVEP